MNLAAVAMVALRLHPDNPHYFLHNGKPTVLVTSGEHYGAVLNRAFNYNRYLDTLHRDGLNLTRIFSGTYREVPGDFKISNNTLAPAPGKFLAPWRQRAGKFDLTRWDPAYFARLKKFLEHAARRGIIVELVLFCPFYEESMWQVSPMNSRNNVNGIGAVARQDVLALKDARLTEVQDALVRQIIAELRGFDNLYYEICNEPYFQGVTLEWQEHIARVITEAEASYPNRHLIAQNWSNGSKVVDRPNPLVSLYNFHYSRPPESVAMNWHLGRAIGNNETGFDGSADSTYRIQGWDFLMAGGALYNNLDYSFTAGHEDGFFVPAAETPGGGSTTLRRQLGILKRFFDGIPFIRMHPAAAGVVQGPERSTVRVLADPGKIYAIYVHYGRMVKDAKPRYVVDSTPASRELKLNLPPGSYTATVLNPRTGEVTKIDRLSDTLTLPSYSEDIAVVIR
jgi:hypothetical protein